MARKQPKPPQPPEVSPEVTPVVALAVDAVQPVVAPAVTPEETPVVPPVVAPQPNTGPSIEYIGEGAEQVKFEINPKATAYRVYANGQILETF